MRNSVDLAQPGIVQYGSGSYNTLWVRLWHSCRVAALRLLRVFLYKYYFEEEFRSQNEDARSSLQDAALSVGDSDSPLNCCTTKYADLVGVLR
ncbi:hypothetical protein [Nostoc sp. C110]|uniref:hypothetical protein n=1 Tax=Nostoc sp. C110 TaxID=3349876 RepID=UPI00370D3EC2